MGTKINAVKTGIFIASAIGSSVTGQPLTNQLIDNQDKQHSIQRKTSIDDANRAKRTTSTSKIK